MDVANTMQSIPTAQIQQAQSAQEISAKLKAYFPENELEWRVQQSGETASGKPYALVLCYVQARAIENRLDEVLGFQNWQNEIRVEGENIIARLGAKIGGEWVWKENGSSQTDIEAFKGGISGAIKRVASSGFGIGRYLYELEATFAECSLEKVDGWNCAKLKSGKKFWWKTPQIPAKFLPTREAAAESAGQKRATSGAAQESSKRMFTEEEEEAAKKFAVSLDPECTQRSFNEVLNRMGIASLTQIEYARKSEFLKILKAVVAESRAAAESGADNGVA